jgi:hypothetical protein
MVPDQGERNCIISARAIFMNPRRPWERDETSTDDEQPYDPDRPDPIWDLGDVDDDDDYDDAGRRRLRLWVIIIAILIVLALLVQLGWPLVIDFLDSDSDTGFPTPGTV